MPSSVPHKSEIWQQYAAAVAVTYAMTLPGVVSSGQLGSHFAEIAMTQAANVEPSFVDMALRFQFAVSSSVPQSPLLRARNALQLPLLLRLVSFFCAMAEVSANVYEF
jgi:hypothetical protein